MKKNFIGYYPPTDEEINKSWEVGFFAFDTNTLLNLYRYTESTRIDFLKTIKAIKSRLFLPFQVALEYHDNRRNVIGKQNEAYDNLLNDIEKISLSFDNQINQFKKHPSISIEKIFRMKNKAFKKIKGEIKNQKIGHTNFLEDDLILNEVTELFDGKIGDDFSMKELEKIYGEGEDRYNHLIPPGFKDKQKEQRNGMKKRKIYGDLIIWKELIKFGQKVKKTYNIYNR